MKALEILKDIRNIETEYNHLKKHRFDQAIEELEDMKSRSCENCKYWNYQFTHSLYKSCTFGLIEHSYEESSFYCNKWESI